MQAFGGMGSSPASSQASPFGAQDTSQGVKVPPIRSNSSASSTSSASAAASSSHLDDLTDLCAGWEHDPVKMSIKFACARQNWKAHLPKLRPDVVKLHALYRQATVGDAPPDDDGGQRAHLDEGGKEKWDEWCRWRGTEKDVAKRRYITYLRGIDEKLVKVTLNERPPFGFPKTDRGEQVSGRSTRDRETGSRHDHDPQQFKN